MIVYETCESDVTAIVDRVMKDTHLDLRRADLKVDCVYAFNAEGGPGVLLHGYPCAATIKIVPYKQRVLGRGDVELTIDRANWDDATEKQRLALIDHELTHVVLRLDEKKGGAVMLDKAGRPKVSMRLHDWQMGGFDEVAQRHGHNAPEIIVAKSYARQYEQLCLAFAEPVAK